MSNSDRSPAAPIREGNPPKDKTHVVSMHRWVQTNLVSGRILQPANDPVVTNILCHQISKVEGEVSGLGTVHPLLTLNFSSTWRGVVT